MALRPARSARRARLYFEAAAGVVLFISFGRMLEARAEDHAGSALRSLLALGARDAAVLRDGAEVRVAVDDLEVGMRFVVRPGETIATDGVVVEGRSAIDASLLTGESNPIEVGPDDGVTGATVNVGGRLVVGGDTGRGRHPARQDRPPRHRGPGVQDEHPTPGRPHLRGVRAGRARPGHA